MNIIPGILTTSFESIESLTESVAHYTRMVHLDVCDGQFVQSKTWPYSNNKTGNIEDNIYVKQILSEEIGLPHWDKVDYQFDLMVKNPLPTLETWMRIGATTVILHPASFETFADCLAAASFARGISLYVGVAVTFDEWETYKTDLDTALTEGQFDILHIMTIAQVGTQSQPFDTRWSTVLPTLAETYTNVLIQVDGGINEKTVDTILDAGIETAIIGSGIFKDGNASENLEYFKSI